LLGKTIGAVALPLASVAANNVAPTEVRRKQPGAPMLDRSSGSGVLL
jgi:hypothetical protein